MRLLILGFVLFSFFGCANYVGQWHRKFDGPGKSYRSRMPKNYDKFARYRKKGNYRKMASSRTRKFYRPRVKRKYFPKKRIHKRYTADDLADNGSDGGLWSGVGKDSYLFFTETKKKIGDIILIQVMGKLKSEIAMELKRLAPKRKKKKKGDKKVAGKEKPKAARKPAAGGDKDKKFNESKVYDRISSIIIEEINKDHILLRGQKFVLFNHKKRLVEIQALVPRKKINEENAVASKDIIEQNIRVVR